MIDQDSAFVAGEADRYWQRNRRGIQELDLRFDLPFALIGMYGYPQTVLEIGAANGYRLDWIDSIVGVQAVAVDPSAEAIADGQARYPNIRFVQATAATMDLQGEQFDLVIVNYVLHWVDRTHLLQSVANIDRVVKDGGKLIIGDFAPANRTKVPYHHKPGLYTYKQDYARLFIETGLYHPVAMLTSAHGARHLEADVPETERYACWLLEKRLTDHYVTTPRQEGV